jgi:hypothetical protein
MTTRMNLFPVGVRGYDLIKWQAITSFGCRGFWGATGLGPTLVLCTEETVTHVPPDTFLQLQSAEMLGD